jgi:predicted nucleic-acid-binding Zn-ribbon protein
MRCPRCGHHEFERVKESTLNPAWALYGLEQSPYYLVCKKCGFSPSFASKLRDGELALHLAKAEELVHGLTVLIDLEGEKRVIHPSGFLKGWLSEFGRSEVEEHFKTVDTAERLIKALKKIGYRDVMEIEMDGSMIYEHPQIKRDVPEVVRMMSEKADQSKSANEIKIKILHSGHPRSVAEIRVDRVHPTNDHSIEIRIEKVERKDLKKLVESLEEELGTRRIKYSASDIKFQEQSS